jgi:excisionase family DNA binding protein
MPIEFLPQKRFFRPDEVADFLLITKRTVYRMIRDGRLAGVDLARRPWRIPREAIVNLFQTADSPPYADSF